MNLSIPLDKTNSLVYWVVEFLRDYRAGCIILAETRIISNWPGGNFGVNLMAAGISGPGLSPQFGHKADCHLVTDWPELQEHNTNINLSLLKNLVSDNQPFIVPASKIIC